MCHWISYEEHRQKGLGSEGFILKEVYQKPGVVMHAFNPCTQKAEAGRSMASKPAWPTRVSSGIARATQRNSASKYKTNQQFN